MILWGVALVIILVLVPHRRSTHAVDARGMPGSGRCHRCSRIGTQKVDSDFSHIPLCAGARMLAFLDWAVRRSGSEDSLFRALMIRHSELRKDARWRVVS